MRRVNIDTFIGKMEEKHQNDFLFFLWVFLYTLYRMKYLHLFLISIFFLASCSSQNGKVVSGVNPSDPLSGKLIYPNLVTNYGIAGLGRASIEYQFKEMRKIGLQIVRKEITWASVEQRRGSFNFRWFDKIVNMALENKLKFLGILAYGNKWASKEGSKIPGWDGTYYPPDNVEDFANYVYTTVQHYRGKIKMWEIWNEPNGGYRFWKSSIVGDPDSYGKLLEAAYTAVKKACPECIVSYGGLFYHQEVVMGAPLYLEKSFEYHPNLGNYFDVLAYHPYPFYPPMAAPESDQFLETPLYDMNYNLLSVLRFHNVVKPLWITEVGWPTIYSLSITQQAEYLVRSFVLSYATGAKMYLYFTFWDSDKSRAIVPPEAEFGLFNYPYATTNLDSLAKPGWFAYKTVVKLLGGKWFSGECNKEVDFDPAAQFALEFTSSTGKICVVWQKDGKSPLKAVVPPDFVLSVYGEPVKKPEITPSPIYLIWK